MTSRIMYIERKVNLSGGAAHIGRVTFSKTGRKLYYRGMSFKPVKGYKYNHQDVESGEKYWISGCKKDGSDRLYGERVPIQIDDDVREEYWTAIRNLPANVNQASTF
jgi:hypothetical protein